MPTMRKPQLLPALALASLASGLLACADITSPVPVSLVHDSSPATAFSKGGEHDNEHAHAIHVGISTTVSNVLVADEYSFNAVRHGDDVNGQFEFFQTRTIGGVSQAVVIASGPIVCLTVVGNRARVGGRVESTTFPGIPVGSEITWSLTDNGKSANADDTASEPLGNVARAFCELGAAYPEHPVERGKVQVMD
jgi:hypothetical protein